MTGGDPTILITGCPRSGTTWLGRVLSASPNIRYVHEPFNFKTPSPATAFRSRHSFDHISENDDERLMPLERLFTGQSLLWTRPRAGVSLRRFSLWYLKQLVSPRKTRTLIKDPLAFLSAESLARRFDTKVVVITRRPESVVASFIRRGWDFHDLKRYVGLMRPLEIWTDEELEPARRCGDSKVERVAHLWRLLALWGMQLETRNPSWNFIRYEDLAADPEQEFCLLCGALGIEFDDRKRALLRSMNRPSRSEPGSEQVKDTYRMRSELPDPDTVLTRADDELVKSICCRELALLYPETSAAMND